MSFYTCFDWLKKLRLFVNERNLRIDVVLKASRAVVIMWFSLNEALLGILNLFPIICLILKKNIYIFQYHNKKFEIIYMDWSKLSVRFIRNNLNQVVHTLAYPGVYDLIEIISSWTVVYGYGQISIWGGAMGSDRKWYRAHAWSEVTEKALSGSHVTFSLNFFPVLFFPYFFPPYFSSGPFFFVFFFVFFP
jgi:hypothetical protein